MHAGPAEPAKIKYEAESPDEAALVAAGKVFGFFFYKRTNTTVFVRETEGSQQQETEYEILNILEFDSTRKRMSIICRTPEGKLKLYCKVRDCTSSWCCHTSSFDNTTGRWSITVHMLVVIQSSTVDDHVSAVLFHTHSSACLLSASYHC